jgi:hypothetical protein
MNPPHKIDPELVLQVEQSIQMAAPGEYLFLDTPSEDKLREYEMPVFTFYPDGSNRKVNNNHIRILSSIFSSPSFPVPIYVEQSKNYAHLFYVIDGQHRLKAWLANGLPVYYKIMNPILEQYDEAAEIVHKMNIGARPYSSKEVIQKMREGNNLINFYQELVRYQTIDVRNQKGSLVKKAVSEVLSISFVCDGLGGKFRTERKSRFQQNTPLDEIDKKNIRNLLDLYVTLINTMSGYRKRLTTDLRDYLGEKAKILSGNIDWSYLSAFIQEKLGHPEVDASNKDDLYSQIVFQDLVGEWITESGLFRRTANGYEWVGERK